jgi:hypothetical protein
MAGHVIAIIGLGALCGAWVLVQQFFARHDPGAPGVEKCPTCGSKNSCATSGGHAHGHHHG